ncbi:MAG: ATP-binding cassette domain-containing protein [Porphyromonas sp.]|uniref:ABC transporter ATP-binding protein n=1 Tax=Porphyromonas sp. TaxID=1924944 RepID=UPI002A90CD48|nr:ATP-binding cassette domain-containing protein [Porphyromonas sp.]MDD7468397.1 ATP-binding cassette domain-containing protein [Bacteroidales bacterium]MDY6101767.1 ATP-binding cassette domain-containing protein [Porphyromonas sp.]
MENYLLEARDIVKDFSAHRALDHASLRVERGKIHGLLGPNGAGKTTLIRVLTRLTVPDEGEITFAGHPFTSKDLTHIGYLPEERGLYPKMKVGKQALYFAQLKGLERKEAERRLRKWFDRLDIIDWWDKKVGELSKGMAQKVQFICTIIHQPDLLIFDEPFSGFDPINAEILKREMLRLRDEGHSIIFSTHDMYSVEELCDNITLINRSHVVLDGDIHEVRNDYRGNLYRIVYDSEIELPEEVREKFAFRTDETNLYGQHTLVIENTPGMSSRELLATFGPIGEVVSYEEIIPSMNDIFIDVVKKSGAPTELQSITDKQREIEESHE